LGMLLVLMTALFLTACFVPSCSAQAQTTQAITRAQGFGDILSSLFINYIAPILGFAILTLISILSKKIFAWIGITLSASQQDYMTKIADTLVRSAQEMAAKQIAETGNKIGFKGSDKLASVIGGLTAKFPKLSNEDAEKIALAAVNRIPGIGLTGNELVPVTLSSSISAISG